MGGKILQKLFSQIILPVLPQKIHNFSLVLAWREIFNQGILDPELLLKKRDCTICVAKTKALISFAVTTKLVCSFVLHMQIVVFLMRWLVYPFSCRQIHWSSCNLTGLIWLIRFSQIICIEKSSLTNIYHLLQGLNESIELKCGS